MNKKLKRALSSVLAFIMLCSCMCIMNVGNVMAATEAVKLGEDTLKVDLSKVTSTNATFDNIVFNVYSKYSTSEKVIKIRSGNSIKFTVNETCVVSLTTTNKGWTISVDGENGNIISTTDNSSVNDTTATLGTGDQSATIAAGSYVIRGSTSSNTNVSAMSFSKLSEEVSTSESTTETTTTTTTTTETSTETTTASVESSTETTTSSANSKVYPSKAVEMKTYIKGYDADTDSACFKFVESSYDSSQDRLSITKTAGAYISFKVENNCIINVTVVNKDAILYKEGQEEPVISSFLGSATAKLSAGNYYFVNTSTKGASNITALSFETAKITGTVTVDDTAKSGVKVALKNGSKTVAATTTDTNGAYTFDSANISLTENTAYTVSVAKGNAYTEDGSATVTYNGENVTADTIALTAVKYTVRFHTDIKDYKSRFTVKDESGATVCDFNSDTNVYTNTYDDNYSEEYRKSALNKYYDLPVGTYTITYGGTNFIPEVNGTSLADGASYTFSVPSTTRVNIVMKPIGLTDTDITNIDSITVDGSLVKGNTSLKNLTATSDGVYAGTGVTASIASSNKATDGLVGATTVSSGYVVFVVPEGTYNVSITTSMNSGSLYAYSDGASINGTETLVALDSNFGTYTLSLTGGKYVIKGATSSATEVKNIALYDYSVFEVVAKTYTGDDGLIIVSKLKDDAVNAGITPESFNSGDLAVVFALATDENLATLQNPVNFSKSLSLGQLYYETFDTMYEKIYNGDDMIVGDDDGYYHGFEIDGINGNFYVVAAVKSNDSWSPDASGIVLVTADGIASIVE